MTRINVLHLGICILLPCVIATAASAQSTAASDDAATKLASQVCSSCHGPGGHSVSPTFPKLAAQQQAYLVAQIQAFKSGGRSEQEAHDYMLGMTTLIDDDTAAALARYFARQSPPHGVSSDPALVAAGQKLFTQGIGDRVVACASCHGDHAQGNGIFPRLAGQHAPYIVRQLKVIQGNLRNSPVMHGIIKNLTPEEMNEVAAYLQSL
ncbi:Cytochrome c553 [Dyella sp. OK004]|uniref:c-type cytochrome n=1 Tax=Dyella sp. OK004 TaxID=1855292 RepID=UPI0008F0CDF4|nr:c-type cytochrome [Dyella sp. OK004]SFS13908.1 Cytochrome c553 [Dyella sp. OK004]